MKVIQVSDELYDKLKSCVVDPFDDTPESVISRLVDIVDRAKKKWSPLDAHVERPEHSAAGALEGTSRSRIIGREHNAQPWLRLRTGPTSHGAF